MGPSPLTLLRDNTDVTIANTVTETALFTYPIPAFTLDGDRGLRMTIRGRIKNHTGGTEGCKWRVKLGATTLWGININNLGTTASESEPWQLRLEVVAKNSDAEQELYGEFGFSADLGAGKLLNGEGGVTTVSAALFGESTEDGTTDLDLVVTCELSVADADLSVMHRMSIVELL